MPSISTSPLLRTCVRRLHHPPHAELIPHRFHLAVAARGNDGADTITTTDGVSDAVLVGGAGNDTIRKDRVDRAREPEANRKL
jgi:hypothetical protein